MKLRRLHTGKTLQFYTVSTETELELPFVGSSVSAGFPSPADDFLEDSIDLNKELIKNPYSTFFVRVNGNSLQDIRIYDGDLMIVDKSLEPKDGKIAVCFIDGEFTAKRLKIEKDHCWLMPENEEYEPILVTEENELMIWGIVTYAIKGY